MSETKDDERKEAEEKLEKNIESMLDGIAEKGFRKKVCKLVKYLLGIGFIGMLAGCITWYIESLVVSILVAVTFIVVVSIVLHKAVSMDETDKKIA